MAAKYRGKQHKQKGREQERERERERESERERERTLKDLGRHSPFLLRFLCMMDLLTLLESLSFAFSKNEMESPFNSNCC